MGVKKKNDEKNKDLRPIDLPLFKYWEALYLSFYSKALYVDVNKRWKGFGFFYLLMLTAILCVPVAIKGIENFSQYFEQELVSPIKHIPTLYIRSGEVYLDDPQPYFVKNKEGKPVVMIDTTKEFNEFPEEYPSVNLLITRNKMFFRTPDPAVFFNQMTADTQKPTKTIYVHDLDEMDTEVFSGKDWIETAGIARLKLLGQVLVYPIMLFSFFGRLLVFLLVFAFLGQLVSRYFYSLKLTFRESSRLLAVASTPTMATVLLAFVFNIHFNLLSLFYVIILAMYFSFAIIAIKNDRGKVVIS